MFRRLTHWFICPSQINTAASFHLSAPSLARRYSDATMTKVNTTSRLTELRRLMAEKDVHVYSKL